MFIYIYMIKMNASIPFLLCLEVFEIMVMELDYHQWILNQESVNWSLLL